MEREIKFRAWNGGGMLEWENLKSLRYAIQNNGITVMQFTGLKDKNGKEIYEGDIVRTETEKVMVISWSEKFASFVIDREGWAFSHFFGESCNNEDVEVIGNIYENPELLNPPIK